MAVSNSTYIEDSEERFGQVAKQRLLRVFDAFGLPDPQPGEYIRGDEANLLFLNRYGLVMRTSYKSYLKPHDLILQPLASTGSSPGKCNDYCIELLPGVNAVLDDFIECELLGALLEEADISFHDMGRENAGYLPYYSDDFPKGVPIVIDRDAISPLNFSFPHGRAAHDIRKLKSSFNREAIKGIQESFYSPLISALRQAWPEKSAPNKQKLISFLGSCAEEINRFEAGASSILSNQWMRVDLGCKKPQKAIEAAKAYDLRL